MMPWKNCIFQAINAALGAPFVLRAPPIDRLQLLLRAKYAQKPQVLCPAIVELYDGLEYARTSRPVTGREVRANDNPPPF